MAITGMMAAIYTSDPTQSTPFTDKSCLSSSLDDKRYRIADTSLRYWDLDYPILLEISEDDGPYEIVTAGYTLEHVGGFIVFEEAVDSDLYSVRVSGRALVVEPAGGFFNWNLDLDAELAESSTFGSNGWKTFQSILLGWSGSADAYWGNTEFFERLGEIMVVQLFIDKDESLNRFEGFMVLNGQTVDVPVDDLIEESIDFTGTGPLYIRFDEEAL